MAPTGREILSPQCCQIRLRKLNPGIMGSETSGCQIEHRVGEVDPFISDPGDCFQQSRRKIARADAQLDNVT